MNGHHQHEKSSPRDIVKPKPDLNGILEVKMAAASSEMADSPCGAEMSAGSCVRKVPENNNFSNQKRFTPPSLRSISCPLESDLEVPGTPKTPRTSTTPGIFAEERLFRVVSLLSVYACLKIISAICLSLCKLFFFNINII